jgi:hypothetical protein
MAVETLSNVGADLNLSLMQGKYWSTQLTLRDGTGLAIDVTGYQFRGHIRQTPTGVLVAAFTFTIVDAPNGVVRAELPSELAATLVYPRYVYDWEYVDNADEEHALVKGSISVVPEVTHA